MIEVEGLTKYYGASPAIRNLSFRIEKGEIVGFLGPNAAGKTTTMRILTGFFPATSGTAQVAGFDVAEAPIEVKRRVGYLPESVPLYTEMLVSRFLSYVAEIKGVSRANRKREVGRVLERCGLDTVRDRIIGHLSKGYRQRVGLAQALIGDPPVLILDEPTVGLDPKQIIEIRQTIKDLANDHTVLLSTHILPEVAMVCRRVLIIHRGRIVAEDSMDRLTGASDTIEIEAEGPVETVLTAIRSVTGSLQVECTGQGQYKTHGAADAATRRQLSEALVSAGCGISLLRPVGRTLEDVFVEATSGQEDAA
ncbi:MAG TPA: ATP-binding cassette domain-containing protein [Candidatus Hydrogenedentes bacterium]|nr:ATP-binding cassette domain-containing protein [Candidatus Hydrogenedentota bacterium]HOS01655.1 ATP-binding cassette domain-containing protein [Candidatus Hydrogenedentota bacterium]